MSVFSSPFNLSRGQWNNGPDLSNDGDMSYSWGHVSLSTSSYHTVYAAGPTVAQITVVNGRLARYYASADSTDVKMSGHSFYSTFQTRGVSVDEAVAVSDSPEAEYYYSNGIREGSFGPSTGSDNSRIMLFGVSS